MSVCVIGAGASGCVCAYFLLNRSISVTIFDAKTPLLTLLPTGGGRCNLAHSEYDFKELAKNYPRGEKFLYSIFSKFSTQDTITLFNKLGIDTYTQEDGRIFPKSNSSKDVREKILASIKKAEFIKEGVNDILPMANGYKIKTQKAEYFFDKVVIATGGFRCKNNNFSSIKNPITDIKPSLVGLQTNVKNLSGVSIKNVYSKDCGISGDILFTHFGISGPLIYKISSIKAYERFPYELIFDLCPKEFDFQSMLDKNSHKDLKNIISAILPQRLAEEIAGEYAALKGYTVNSKIRDYVLQKIHNYELIVYGTDKGEETVTAGGYDLDYVNSKTMESKLHKGLFVIGEALDIDGFCGGYNLQNAWSTAFVAAQAIN